MIEITVCNMVLVKPWVDKLTPLLSYTKKIFDPFKNKMEFKTERLSFIDTIEGVKVGYLPEGLLTKVLDFLNRSNIKYNLTDKRKWANLPMPKFENVLFNELREGQAEAIEAIATNQVGVIKAATGYGKSYLIVQICRMYPDLNIVVTTARVAVLKELYKRLSTDPLLKGSVGCISGWKNTGNEHRITVSTIKSLIKVDMPACDLLLADECHNFGASCAAELVNSFINARKFGLSASPKGRQDNTDLVTESLFGKALFDYSYQDAVDTGAVVPIKVHMYDIKCGNISMFKTPLSRKRHGLWRNLGRNKKIAELAKMHLNRGAQVLIMVESVEHLMYLKKQLPEAAIAYASCSKVKFQEYVNKGLINEPYKTPKELAAVQLGMEEGTIRLCIATMVFKEGVNFKELDVLIRGESQSGDIPLTQIGGRLSRTLEGKEEGILIDFINSFDPSFFKASKARINKYKEKKWEIKYEDRL